MATAIVINRKCNRNGNANGNRNITTKRNGEPHTIEKSRRNARSPLNGQLRWRLPTSSTQEITTQRCWCPRIKPFALSTPNPQWLNCRSMAASRITQAWLPSHPWLIDSALVMIRLQAANLAASRTKLQVAVTQLIN